MRCAFAILVSAFISAAAFSSPAAHNASKQEILATVKHLSAEDCKPRIAGSLHIVGCDYSAAFIQGEWQVLALEVLDEGGKHVHPSGGTIYILNVSGRLTKIIPGM